MKWRSTEPPDTEPYVRWCGRTAEGNLRLLPDIYRKSPSDLKVTARADHAVVAPIVAEPVPSYLPLRQIYQKVCNSFRQPKPNNALTGRGARTPLSECG